MKKLPLIILLLLGISFASVAQKIRKTPEQRAAHMTKSLQKSLNLTSVQASKINAILLSKATEVDKLKENTSGDKKEDHLAKKSLKLSADKKIMAVLSNQQQKEYLQWEKMKQAKHRAKKGANPVEG